MSIISTLTANQPGPEYPAVERWLPAGRDPWRRRPGPDPAQICQPHLHVLPSHLLLSLPHPVAPPMTDGPAPATRAATRKRRSWNDWGGRDRKIGVLELVWIWKGWKCRTNLLRVTGSSYGRTCDTFVCYIIGSLCLSSIQKQLYLVSSWNITWRAMERSQVLNLCEMAVFRRWSLEDYVVLNFVWPPESLCCCYCMEGSTGNVLWAWKKDKHLIEELSECV